MIAVIVVVSFIRSTFHGSLRKSPKPTSADLVEEEDRHTPQKTVEEPPKPQEDHEPLKTTVNDRPMPKNTPTDTPITKTTPTETPIPQTMSSVQPDEDEACLLCDKPIDVCIKPCGHAVLCRSHANTAKRCPQCRVCQQLSLYVHCVSVTVLLSWLLQGPIHCVDDLDPLCGMCQERRCTVTLKPCGHMMCEGLLLVLSCTCVDVYMCVHVCTCTCTCLYLTMMHRFVHVCICASVYMCVYVQVHIYSYLLLNFITDRMCISDEALF